MLTQVGDVTRALTLIDQAVAHTPTLLELYVLHARVNKHAGDIQHAAIAWEQACEMYLQDR